MLAVEGLRVSVDGRVVVEDASLRAPPGRVTFVFGPNAAGKSSLLAAIAGLPGYRVLAGRIVVDGEDVTKLPCWERARRGVVLGFQNPPVSRFVRARQLVEWMARTYGWSLAEVLELARRLGVDGLLDRPLFRGASGGERKRLELLMVLLQRPRVALLDEPDSGVDLDSLRLVSWAVLQLVEAGAAVVLVSHTMRIVGMLEKAAGEAYVMLRGRIVYSGPAAQVVRVIEERGFQGIEGA